MLSRWSALAMGVGLAVAAAWPGAARAHVAPSPDTNNRYLKVTLLGDRVRLTYLVFYGERPGHALRARLDENGSGDIDATEAARFAQEVRESLTVRAELDGTPASGDWRVVDVGLGTPSTQGGAFSIDLMRELPAAPGGSHQLLVVDGWQVELPGESELRIEESPGVRVVAAHHPSGPLGVRMAWAFTGNPRTEDERAVVIEYVTTSDAPVGAAPVTAPSPAPPAPRSPSPPGRTWLMVGGSTLALVFATVSMVRARRRKRRLLGGR